MRTTITIDDDVASRLERLKKTRPFKDLVNEALREGLDQMERRRSAPPEPYVIVPVMGKPRRTDLDNVAELIAELDGDNYK
jgi:hypothetical protein